MKKLFFGLSVVVMVIFFLSLRGAGRMTGDEAISALRLLRPEESGLAMTENQAMITFPNAQSMRVDVADDPSEHAQGLSHRTEPQPMPFLFAQKSTPAFWMKDMQFAMDILWLDDGRIVGFEKNMQPENPAKTFYRSKMPMNGALEVPTGTVDQLSLKVGDLLDIEWKAQ